MAATIAHAYGRGKNSESHASRLGHESSKAQAATFKTFATAEIEKDGSGYVQIERILSDGRRSVIHRAEVGAEDQEISEAAQVKILPWGNGAEVSRA